MTLKNVEDDHLVCSAKCGSSACSCQNGSCDSEAEEVRESKMGQLCKALFGASLQTPNLRNYEHVPAFLQNNPFIRSGYRAFLSDRQCVRSLFWWTNETVNIWTHIAGFLLFLSVLLYDIVVLLPVLRLTIADRVITMLLLLCFMLTMALSAVYHTFCCHSESKYRRWLQWDITGITLSFTAIFASGIHFAFSCFLFWKIFYLVVVGMLTVSALAMHMHPSYNPSVRQGPGTVLFLLWALFGFVPTFHWALLHGGFSSDVISTLLPRVLVMYVIAGTAFFFYASRYPERCCPGKVDYLGSSHQLWHVLVVVAMLWWHDTGVEYARFLSRFVCEAENNLSQN